MGIGEWRAPVGRRDDSDNYSQPFRTCDYCGSISPEDLYRFLIGPHPVVLHMADWKYSWPHKFYVDGIPNLAAGQTVTHYAYGSDAAGLEARYTNALGPAETYESRWANDVGFRLPLDRKPAPAMCHAKFYNEHLRDLCGTPQFGWLAKLLHKHSGVEFVEDGDQIRYRLIPWRE